MSENRKNSLLLDYNDLDCIYHNENKKIDIFNLSKMDLKKILNSLEITYANNPSDKNVKKLINRFKNYLNIFSK